MAKCPYCGRYKPRRDEMFEHMEKYHAAELEREGLDAARALYRSTHGTTEGACMMCGRPTAWNDATGKPRKLCDDPNCRRKMKAQYDRNLQHARGIDQHTLMSDMEHQREMLRRRHISGTHRFSDGGEVEHVGKLELAFLEFCDRVVGLRANQVLPSPEAFPYDDPKDGQVHLYIPDYYLPDYNLLVEIKDENNGNPAFLEETRYKVPLKDEAMRKQRGYNYIRISGTNYGPFMDMLFRIVHDGASGGSKGGPLVVIDETAGLAPGFDEEEMEEIPVDTSASLDVWAIFGYIEGTNLPRFAAVTNSPGRAIWYVSDHETCVLYAAEADNPVFAGKSYALFRYMGPREPMENALSAMMAAAHNVADQPMWNVLDILGASGINVDVGEGFRNNRLHATDFQPTNLRWFEPARRAAAEEVEE